MTRSFLENAFGDIVEDTQNGGMEKADIRVSAVLEYVSSFLGAATKEELNLGAEAAHKAAVTVQKDHNVNTDSPDYLAGQLIAVFELLSFAASQTPPSELIEAWKTPLNLEFLKHFLDKALSEREISSDIMPGRCGTMVSILREMSRIGALHPHNRANEKYWQLTSACAAFLRQRLEK